MFVLKTKTRGGGSRKFDSQVCLSRTIFVNMDGSFSAILNGTFCSEKREISLQKIAFIR